MDDQATQDLAVAIRIVRLHCPIEWPCELRWLNCHAPFPCNSKRVGVGRTHLRWLDRRSDLAARHTYRAVVMNALRPGAVVRGAVSAHALRDPEAALQLIEAHLRADLGGRCARCGGEHPCKQLELGYAGLIGTNVLPRRTPMALLPEKKSFNAFVK